MNSTRLKVAASADQFEKELSLVLKKTSTSHLVVGSTLQWRLQMVSIIMSIVLIALWAQCVIANKHDTESHYRSASFLYSNESLLFENLIDEYNDDQRDAATLSRSLTETVPMARTEDAGHLLQLHSQLISNSPIDRSERMLATDHYRYIKNHFSCSVPRPKLVKVKDHYNLTEEFIPRYVWEKWEVPIKAAPLTGNKQFRHLQTRKTS